MEHDAQAYWQQVTGKRILIIGPLPPPLGGVAVHVARVAEKLRALHNDVSIHASEPCGRSLFFWLYAACLRWRIRQQRPTDIYYHGTYLPNSDRELMLLGTLQKKYAFTLHIVEHDCRHLHHRSPTYHDWYRTFVIAHRVNLILIGSQTAHSYRTLAMPTERTMHAHAFLPPSTAAYAQLSIYPSQFWQLRIRHRKLIIMNAFASIRHGTKDLYGIRDAIDATLALRAQHEDVALCILMATIGDAAYMQQLYAQARASNGAIFFIIGNFELWPLLPHADIFIRPTYSDGDSVSVREALWANIRVVASNVCIRPVGVITYDPYVHDGLRNALSSR